MIVALPAEALSRLAETSLRLLAEGSLRAVAMAVATAVVLMLFRVRDARVRHAAWGGMLVFMLLSPLAIAWGPKARVPVRAPEPIVRAVNMATLDLQLPAIPVARSARPAAARTAFATFASDWRLIAGGLYFAIVFVLLARIANGVYRVRRLLRGASPGATRTGVRSTDGERHGIQPLTSAICWPSTTSRSEADALSDVFRGALQCDYLTHPACAVPVVVGWFRPRIILPADCHEWPADRLAMVLAHERAHARRRDSIVRLMSLINRAVFWFHPLAWWLHREIAALAEEACDATAAAAAPSQSAYADCLIAIARHARRAGQRIERVERVEPVAIGMASTSTALHRRVRAILAGPQPPSAPRRTACVRALGALLLLACLTATPVQTIAALRRIPTSAAAAAAARTAPTATAAATATTAATETTAAAAATETTEAAAATAATDASASAAAPAAVAAALADDPIGGFTGTFVVRDDRGLVDVRYNAERADLRFSPCSTFKLPFAVMFLENGIVPDPDTVVKYEPRFAAGLMSGPPGTAHDQSLTSAFHESANWYFDTISRSLDRTIVEQFTARSGYGNADVRDAAEDGSYWYDGRLRISANEQVRFLQRLHNGELGVSARTTNLIKRMAQAEATTRWRLAGKTGACRGVGDDATTHWYVGWVERADNTYYFALQFAADGFEPALRERVPIAKRLLTQLHILD